LKIHCKFVWTDSESSTNANVSEIVARKTVSNSLIYRDNVYSQSTEDRRARTKFRSADISSSPFLKATSSIIHKMAPNYATTNWRSSLPRWISSTWLTMAYPQRVHYWKN